MLYTTPIESFIFYWWLAHSFGDALICPISSQNILFNNIQFSFDSFYHQRCYHFNFIQCFLFFLFFAEGCVYYEIIGRNVRPCKLFLTLLWLRSARERKKINKQNWMQLKTQTVRLLTWSWQRYWRTLAAIHRLFIVFSLDFVRISCYCCRSSPSKKQI